MIGIENNESIFFTVESPDLKLEEQDFSQDVISLSITEKAGAMPQGSLSFYDPEHYYSRILRVGVRLLLSWGYRDVDETLDTLTAKKINLDEISGSLIRRGLEGFVSSPGGSAGEDGVIRYNCNFTSYGMRGTDRIKWFRTGRKADVVAQVFDQIGISRTKRVIDFSRGTEAVTEERAVLQEKTDFLFLNQLALEWRALFQVGFTQEGETVGIFVDNDAFEKNLLPVWVSGAVGKSNAIGWRGEISNVKSYNYKSTEGESGVGDNVRFEIVDGKVIVQRFQAEQQKVITYKLDEEKIQKLFKDADGAAAQARLAQDLLSKKDFESIKHFFIPIEQETAPQGFGYKIKCEMIGNPLYSPPNEIIINNGFPDFLNTGQSKFYIDEVTHNIDRSGYNMSVSIIDTFSLSNIGLVLR